MSPRKSKRSVADIPYLAAEWHSAKNHELSPDSVGAGSQRKVWWKCPKGPDHEWETTPEKRSRRGDGCPCCAGQKVSVTNSLATRFPHIAASWDYERNAEEHAKNPRHPRTPVDVVAGYGKKVWWQCDKGPDHCWDATVESRTRGGNGCPCCAGKKVSVTNSLATRFAHIAASWDHERNAEEHGKNPNHPLNPEDVTAGYRKRVWWRCDKGPDHGWPTTVASRTRGRHGCPYCANQKPSVTNSLASCYPKLAKEFDTDRNGITPDLVVAHSNKKYWWRCEKGSDHVWPTRPAARHRRGCPFCSNKKPSVTNSLASCYPKLAKEFDTDKNGITPDQVVAHSNKKYWWRCDKGPDHAWPTSPATRHRTGCPYCVGKKVSVTNSLAARFPDIAASWDYKRNGIEHAKNPRHPRTPNDVVAGYNKKVWWKCPKGPDHEWETTPNNRTNPGHSSPPGCPFCAGKNPSVTNSLATCAPEVAKEFDVDRNSTTPDRVVVGSNKKYWWKCYRGHQWYAQVAQRTGGISGHRKGTGCTYCYQAATSFPEILLSCELQLFFPDIDHENRKVDVGRGRPAEVDIRIESKKLIIEYDGVYFHKILNNREKKDKEKTELLERLGWRVIRIREEGLNLIQTSDLSVPLLSGGISRSDYKNLVNRVLKHIETVLSEPIDGLDKYLRDGNLVRYEQAKAICNQRRRRNDG